MSIMKVNLGIILNYEGNYIILKHACILKDIGWDTDTILPNISINLF